MIREDFDRDTKGDDEVTNSEFGESLFELADHWVSTVDVDAWLRSAGRSWRRADASPNPTHTQPWL